MRCSVHVCDIDIAISISNLEFIFHAQENRQ